MSFLELFYLLCLVQSVIVSLALIRLKGKKLPNRLLAMHIAVWGMMCFFRFSVFQSKDFILKVHYVLRFNYVIELLMFVFVFLYIKYVTTRLKKFRKQDYLHFVPACIGFLLLMPFFILSGPEKIDAILSHKPTYYEILGEVFYFASIIQGVIYCSLSIKYIREYHKKVKENFSNIEARTLYWLQTILTIVLVILILGPLASSVLHNQFSQYIFNVLYITIGSSIYITSFYMLTQNSLFVENYFTDYPIVGNIDPKQDSNDQSEVLIEEEVLNLSNFQLDHDYSMSIIQKLETTMRQENLYLYHDLSLNTVAQKIKIPRHHISHVLNKMLNTNFFDYINKYRVDEAKRKIEDESLSNYTLIALGLEAGFNSKASFYRNFRKYENMTPLEYKQMIDKQSNKM